MVLCDAGKTSTYDNPQRHNPKDGVSTKTSRAVDLKNLKTDDGAPRVDRLKQL
jgi:hypothetical protein